MQFRHALVRPPGTSYSAGLTNSTEGPPDLPRALDQHRSYCDVLRRCGLDLTVLAEESAHPDGTFVEDTAVAPEHLHEYIAEFLEIIARHGTKAGVYAHAGDVQRREWLCVHNVYSFSGMRVADPPNLPAG